MAAADGTTSKTMMAAVEGTPSDETVVVAGAATLTEILLTLTVEEAVTATLENGPCDVCVPAVTVVPLPCPCAPSPWLLVDVALPLSPPLVSVNVAPWRRF